MNTLNFINIPHSIFNADDSRDGIGRPWFSLYKFLSLHNHISLVGSPFSPKYLNIYVNPKPRQLPFLLYPNSVTIRWEPPVVRPDLWSSLPSNISTLLSWSKDPFTLPHLFINQPMPVKSINNLELESLEASFNTIPINKSICLVNSFKLSPHTSNVNNGYLFRVNLISELSDKINFRLYGFGWSKFLRSYSSFIPYYFKRLSIYPLPKKFYNSVSSCYKGLVASKSSLLAHSSFSLVIENSFDDFYLTEKLVDSLYSGLYPIYIGNVFVMQVIPCHLFSYISPSSTDIPSQIVNIVHSIDLSLWRRNLIDYLHTRAIDDSSIGTNTFISNFSRLLDV